MQRPTEQSTVSSVNFLCEQDGVPERELKAVLANAFSHLGHVTAAYLARVDYGNPDEQHVALCIITDEANPSEIIATTNKLFQRMFNSDSHLDILPLPNRQEYRVAAVCRPFFVEQQSRPSFLRRLFGPSE